MFVDLISEDDGTVCLLQNLPSKQNVPNQDYEDDTQDQEGDSLNVESGGEIIAEGETRQVTQTDNQTILRLLEEGEMASFIRDKSFYFYHFTQFCLLIYFFFVGTFNWCNILNKLHFKYCRVDSLNFKNRSWLFISHRCSLEGNFCHLQFSEIIVDLSQIVFVWSGIEAFAHRHFKIHNECPKQ